MKKIILLSILVISVAAAAIPYFIGTTVEDTFRLELEEAAKDSARSGIDVELIDYQRNYLDATATTRFSIVLPDNEDINKQQTISFDMLHTISHIPQIDEQVIATADTELVFKDEIKAELDQLLKGQSPLVITTRIFFDGHQDGSIHSPSFKGQVGDNKEIAIDWQGMDGQLWQSPERNNFTFNIHLPGVTMSPAKTPASTTDGAKEGTISLRELNYSGKMQRGSQDLWLGSIDGSINSIAVDVIEEGNPFSILINAIGFKGDQNENNGLISGGAAITANSINVNGFLLSNAVYDIAVENIDTNALVAWTETATKITQGKADPNQPFEPLTKYIPALFNAHPVMRIKDLSVDSPMGRFAFMLNTSVTGKWDDMMLKNPALIVPMLKIDLDANLPKPIVVLGLKQQIRNALIQQATLNDTEINAEQIEAMVNQAVEQQLGAMISQGYIKENDSQLQSSIAFDAGKLTINGVDATPFIDRMMQQAAAQ